MEKQLKKVSLVTLISSLVLCGNHSYATNGYALHGIGGKSKALAGGGIALSQDTMIMAMNPAALVHLNKRVDLGAALFSPIREYTVSGSPSGTFPLATRQTDSDTEFFIIPNLGYSAPIDSQSSWGIAAFGNGGMNTDYPDFSNSAFCPPSTAQKGSFCDGNAGINLTQLFITPSYARKIPGVNASWGVSLVGVVQSFEAEGIGTFAPQSADGTKLSDNGADYSSGLGIRASAMIAFMPNFTAAVAYQPKINMSDFNEYSGLFAGGGNFDIPTNWNIGIAWNTSERSVLTFDIQHIKFSDVDSVGNSITQLTQKGNFFGSDNGPGFGWEDMTIYKLGYQWMMSTMPDWTWRMGISRANQPVPDKEVTMNILAPAVVRTHITAGFTKAFGSNNEFTLAMMYAPSETVKGQNAFDPAQEVEIEMQQFEIELGYSWKF